ncbi:hypothetical protein ANCDUO_16040, partial [Ancylostoma duodenale]
MFRISADHPFVKGTSLKKVITNDRSAPQVAGKPSSGFTGGVSINQLEREPKPGSGGRAYTVGNAASLGGLFANGLPSKPSENKIRRANTSVTPSPASASPPQIPKPIFNEGRPSPSNNDFSSRESTPVRAPLTRPSFHPPARPTAPPPPPPIPRANGSTTVEPPPPPVVGPIASGLTSRFGSSPTVSSRIDESAPPPPPRGASKVASSIAPPPVPAMPKYPAKDVHPLDRFTFKPLSDLPPPPIPSQGRA